MQETEYRQHDERECDDGRDREHEVVSGGGSHGAPKPALLEKGSGLVREHEFDERGGFLGLG